MTTLEMQGRSLLEIEGLTKRFSIPGTDSAVHACDSISLRLNAGETLGVIGESGSGKTTLGRCVLRLIEPTEGQIRFGGRSVTDLNPADLRRLRSEMQIVFQEPFDSLNPQMTIGRQITEPLRIHQRMSRRDRGRRALELLERVGLPPTVADMLPSRICLKSSELTEITQSALPLGSDSLLTSSNSTCPSLILVSTIEPS